MNDCSGGWGDYNRADDGEKEANVGAYGLLSRCTSKNYAV